MKDQTNKKSFNAVITQLKNEKLKPEIPILEKAYQKLEQWYAKSGNDNADIRIAHSISSMAIVGRLHLDTPAMAAALLHHVYQDSLVNKKTFKSEFGKEVSSLVEGVTKLSELNFHSRKAEQIKNFRKMFMAIANDIRVILIKLADRRSLLDIMDKMYQEKDQLNIARETMDIYAPIASRLGIGWMKVELEDLSFAKYYPEQFAKIEDFSNSHQIERENYINSVVSDIQTELHENDITGEIYGRSKHFYSIWRKLERKTLELDQLYDILAFRIIVDNLEQCYQVLGIVHTKWRPIQGMFEDYVAMPKPNGYQSLHTNVVGPYGDRMEIQIRTTEMHEIAENGIAAHWRYKEVGHRGDKRAIGEIKQIKWLRQLINLQQEADDPDEVMDSLKVNLYSDQIFVFTPNEDVFELPVGASAVDFAFVIHTQVGLHITGAKVDGKIVPIRSELKSGNVVEIITSKDQKPKREWLEFVKTSRARNKIRHSIREEERESSRSLGRLLSEKEFKELGLNLNKLEKSGVLDKAAEKLKAKNFAEICISVGRGTLKVIELVKQLEKKYTENLVLTDEKDKEEEQELKPVTKRRRSGKSGIIISELDDLLVRFGKCCNPITGDKIVGFITRGRGMTIHRANCSKLKNMEQERILDAAWDEEDDTEMPVTIKVVANDNPVVIQDISAVFTAHNANVRSSNTITKDELTTSYFRVLTKNITELGRILKHIRKLKNVITVERVNEQKI